VETFVGKICERFFKAREIITVLMWKHQTYRNECMKKMSCDEDFVITDLSTKIQPFKNLLFTEVSDRTTSDLA